jgi:hypothetical protein
MRDATCMVLIVALVVLIGLFAIQTNKLIAAVEKVAVSYSSSNHIRCESVKIFHSENYDVAEEE